MTSSVYNPAEGVFSPSHIHRSKGRGVVGVDIDDVLADSTPAWVSFASNIMSSPELCEKYTIPNRLWVRSYQGTYQALWVMKKAVPYYYYRLMKEVYRESETKRTLGLFSDSIPFLTWAKSEGVRIILLTKRSQMCSKLTYDWVERNKIPYDEIIFSKEKHIRILERFPKLLFMVEDNMDIANAVGQWGYHVYLRNNCYNSDYLSDRNVFRIRNLMEIVDIWKNRLS